MLKNTVLPPHTLGAFLPVMSKQSRGIFQQEELSHVRSEVEVVRLEELAVIQQVCQMGHKPPVA